MLAHKYEPKHAKFPVMVEPKLDGIRALVVVDPRERTAQAYSRAGNEFTSVRAIENALLTTVLKAGYRRRIMFDGELTCGTFKQTVSAIKRKNEEAAGARLMLFDILEGWPSAYCRTLTPFFGTLKQRRSKLETFYAMALQHGTNYALTLVPQGVAHNDDEVQQHYTAARAQGAEGVIVKDPEAYWSPKRSRAYLKIKERETADLQVVDALEGEGRLQSTLGALVCVLPSSCFCGGICDPSDIRCERGIQNTVNVGSGIPDEERAELWAMHQRGELAGRTVEVSFHERTPDGSLRHPVYESLRIDK
jgi:DNA ligase-1